MHGQHGVGRLARGGAGADRLLVTQQHVGHDVAHHVHAVASTELRRVRLGGAEQEPAPLVHGDAVELLRHGPVAAARTRFDVRHERAGQRPAQTRRKGGVGVAERQHVSGPLLLEDFDQCLHHGRHAAYAVGRFHLQMHVGLVEAEVREVRLHHGHVGVLAGVHEERLPTQAQRGQQGRSLHELGTGPRDDERFHGRG